MLARNYADVLSACGTDARCFVKNDSPLAPLSGTLQRALLRLRDAAVLPLAPASIVLPVGAGAVAWSCLDGGRVPSACSSSDGFGAEASPAPNCTYTSDTDYQGGAGGSSVAALDAAACCAACAAEAGCVAGVFFAGTCYTKGSGGAPVASPGRVLCSPPPPCAPLAQVLTASGCLPDGTDCVLRTTVVDAGGAVVAANEQLLAPPGLLALTRTAVSARVGDAQADGTIPITLTTSGGTGPSLFVTLFTRANGRFTDNVVTLLPGAPLVVAFVPFGDAQEALLRDSLRVNHLAQYVG